MVELHIETLGDERFVRGFSRFLDDVKDMSPAFELIYADFQDVEAEIFKAHGTPEKWKQLSPDYAAWKAKVRPGRPILVFDGHLKESLTGKNAHSVKKIGKLEAEFGTDLPYAHYHQYGGGRLPKRKPVQLTDPIRERWAKIVHKWAYEELKKVTE